MDHVAQERGFYDFLDAGGVEVVSADTQLAVQDEPTTEPPR